MSEVILAERIKSLLQSLRHPALAPFLDDWPAAYLTRAVAPCQLPVLRWLAPMDGRSPFAAELVSTVCRAALSMAWRQTYSAGELGAAFLDNYGWSEVIGGSGPLAGTHVACGMLVLGPSTLYPRHRHEAEEVYLPLSGTADWQQGGSEWRERAPGTVIHHAGNEPHAMRTGAEPLLALYLWRGAGLSQKARLDS